ncbi:Glycoside hydrolase 2 (Mannanase, beta-galactosidase), partial [Chytridiales sp. JEL 0842]
MSDIIFLRAWYPVKPKKFYNPVSSLLLADKEKWVRLRTTGQIRREEGLKGNFNPDSLYKEIERKPRKFNPLKIPKSLQANLPFASKPKQLSKQKKPGLLQRRAVLLEPHEKKVYSLLQAVNTLKREKERKQKEKEVIKKAGMAKEAARAQEAALAKKKETGKAIYKKIAFK